MNALYFGSKTIRGIDSQFPAPNNGDDHRGLGFTWSNHQAAEPVNCLPIPASLNPTQRSGLNSIREICEEEDIQLLLVNPLQLCEEVFEKPEIMEGLPCIEGNDWPLAKVDTLYYDDHHPPRCRGRAVFGVAGCSGRVAFGQDRRRWRAVEGPTFGR